jgi:hypothetical protein
LPDECLEGVNLRRHFRQIAIALLFAVLTVPPIFKKVYAQTPVTLLPVPRMQFFNGAGEPLAAGCVNFFNAGTSIPAPIYSDSTGMFQLPNPLTLDAAGMASIWIAAQSYRVVVNTGVAGQSCAVNLGTQLWVVDNVSAPPFLGANNAWTGNQTFAGSSTFNGAVNINGTTTFTGSVLGLPGSGTVTNLNVGNLTPLFTATVTNPTTTPGVTFAFVTPATGTGAPVFGTGPTISAPIITGGGSWTGGPTITSPTIATGIAHGGTGFQHIRFTPCNAGTTLCNSTTTWNTTWADTNYTTVCQVIVSAGSNEYTIAVYSLSTTGFSYTLGNLNSGGPSNQSAVDCIGVHD